MPFLDEMTSLPRVNIGGGDAVLGGTNKTLREALSAHGSYQKMGTDNLVLSMCTEVI